MRHKSMKQTISIVLSLCMFLFAMPLCSITASAASDVMLNIPTNLIQQCGNQKSSGNLMACQAYALTYCRIILDNKFHAWTEYRASGQNACEHSVAGYDGFAVNNTPSAQTVLKKIYDSINMGRPAIVRAKGSTAFHYVVAVGYKADCNPQNLKQDDFYILDPYDGIIKNNLILKTANGNYSCSLAKTGGTSINGAGKNCVVTFDPTGGNVSQTSRTVISGNAVGSMPIPKKDGYTFLYWSTEKEGSGLIVRTGNEIIVEKNITLYAVWKEDIPHPVHTYEDDICSVCGAVLSSDNGFDNSIAGKYLVIADTAYVRTGPYQSKSEVYRLSRWDEIDIIGSVINSYGNTWLKTSDGYYTHAEKLEPADTAKTEITFNSLSSPGNLIVGESGHINGSITSSNSPICYVKAEVLDQSGSAYLTAVSSGFSLSKYGPLKNSKIDGDLTFGKLPVGDYYIKYTVTTEDNTTSTAKTSVFRVSAASAGQTNQTDQTSTPSTEPTGHWGPWSGWSSTRYYSSDTRQVESNVIKVSEGYTEYRYGRYIDGTGGHVAWCLTYLAQKGYSGITAQYSSWSTSRYSTSGKGWTCGYCNGNHTGVDHYSSDGRAWWAEYVSPRSGSYFWEESRWIDASYETQYRYRDWISG